MLIENLLSKDFLDDYKEYLEQKIKSLGGNYNSDEAENLVTKQNKFHGRIFRVTQNDVEIKFSFKGTRIKESFEERVTVGVTGFWNFPSNSCKINSIRTVKSSYIVSAVIDSSITLGEFGSLCIGGNFLKLYKSQRDILRRYLKLTESDLITNYEKYKEIYEKIFGVKKPKKGEEEDTDKENSVDDASSYSGLNFELLKEDILRTKQAISQKNIYDPSPKMKLDKYQFFALDSLNRFIKSSNDEPDYRLVWGPPGTGKTQLISRICVDNYQTKKILITSFTNVAVDNALERIKENINSPMDIIVRLGSINKVSPQMKNFMTEVTSKTSIWGCTLDYAMLNLADKNFDLIIIDEASMVALPKILFTFLITDKVILIGDFFQLHPFDDFKEMEKDQFTTKEEIIKLKELASFSYFSYLCLYWLQVQNLDVPEDMKLFPLITNRRSYPGIVSYANERLYQGLMDFDKKKSYSQLIENRTDILPPLLKSIFFNKKDIPVLIIPTDFHYSNRYESYHIRRKFPNTRSGSYGNLGQIAITIQLIRQLLSKNFQKDFVIKDSKPDLGILYIKQIGIISIYNFHIQIIKGWLWKYGNSLYKCDPSKPRKKLISYEIAHEELVKKINLLLNHYYRKWIVDNLEVGTVEKFQGREKDFIITNTVYHPAPKQNKKIQIALQDPKKLNVILTRARYFHIIISSGYGTFTDKNLYTELFNHKWNSQKEYIYELKKQITNPTLNDLNHALKKDPTLESLVKQKENLIIKLKYKTHPFDSNGELVKVVKEITGGEIIVGANHALTIESIPSDDIEPDEEKFDSDIASIYCKSFIKKSRIDLNELKAIIRENIIDECYSYFEEKIKHDPKYIYDYGEFLLKCLLDKETIILIEDQNITDMETFNSCLIERIKEIYEQLKK